MRNCSSTSGTRSARSSSRDASDEAAPALAQRARMADRDLRRRAVGLAMGISIPNAIPLARARPARPLFHLEAIGNLRAVSDPELPEVEAWRLQRLVQR